MHSRPGQVAPRPRLADVAVAVLVTAVGLPLAVAADLDGLGWAGFAACQLPLLWQRRAPVAVFGTILTVAVVLWAGVAADAAFPMVTVLAALYPVARHRPGPWLVPPILAVAAVLALAWWLDGIDWRELALLAAAATTSVLSGLLLRSRDAHLAQRERRRRQRQRLLLAAQRAHIATELHDIVSHNLSVMVALADGAGLTAEAHPHRAAEALETIADSGRMCLDELRRLVTVLHDPDSTGPGASDNDNMAERPYPPPATVHQLDGPDEYSSQPRPSAEGRPAKPEPREARSASARSGSANVPSPQPNLAQLPTLLDQLRATGLRVTLNQNGTPPIHQPGMELTTYRIVQEALTNVLNHAGPQANATVHISHGDRHTDIRVTDDGGPDDRRHDPRPGGRGLTGMTTRAAAYGGQLDAGPLPHGGWQVHTRIESTP